MVIPGAPTTRPAAGQSTRSASSRTSPVITEPQLSDVASLDEPAKVAGSPTAATSVATPRRRSRRRRPVVVSMDVVLLVTGGEVWPARKEDEEAMTGSLSPVVSSIDLTVSFFGDLDKFNN